MTVTAPETAARQRLLTILETEFVADNIDFQSDKRHDSLGVTQAVGGVYPADAAELQQNGLVLETTLYVQLFGVWEKEIDPTQTVDPAAIENWAERFRRAVRADHGAGDAHLWFYRVVRIEYPPDPTGNITRFLATVVAESQNSALVETSG